MSFTRLILLALFLWNGCTEKEDIPPPGVLRSGLSGNLDLHNRLGEQHLGTGQYGPARKAFQEALAGAEDSVRAYIGLSRTYLAQEDFTLAEEAIEQAASLDSNRAEVFYTRAEFYLAQYLQTHQGPQLARALVAARKASDLAPNQPTYFFGLGNLYTYRGYLDSAEVAYRRTLELDPRLAAAYERLASICKYQGRSAEAEKAYQKQLELQPENPQTLCELAALYRADGRLSEARGLLETAVRLDTGLAAAYLNLGQLYLVEGRTEAGKQALARFQELNKDDTATLLVEAEAHPRDTDLQLRLANAYVKDGHFSEAELLYQKVIQLDGDLTDAYVGLGRLYLVQERLGEAEDILRLAREKNASATVHMVLGEIYLRQNRPAMAVRVLEKAIELGADQFRSYDLLASAYRRSGQHQREQEMRARLRELREEEPP